MFEGLRGQAIVQDFFYEELWVSRYGAWDLECCF